MSADPLSAGELRALLDRPWHHLAEGSSVVAYGSPTCPYVLKLFKDVPEVVAATRAWPDFQPSEAERRSFAERRVQRTADSVTLAWRDLRRETGLVAWAARGVPLSLERDGNTLSVEGVPVLVQRRVVTLGARLSRYAAHGEDDRARAALSQLVRFTVGLMRRGIADTDCYFRGNFGYLRDRLIQVDVGSFTYGEAAVRAELDRRRIVTHPTFARLEREQPGWARHLSREVDAQFARLQRDLDGGLRLPPSPAERPVRVRVDRRR